MGIGESIKNTVDILINQLGSEALLMSINPTTNAYGDITSYEVTASSTVNCVPSSYVRKGAGSERFGYLNEGEIRMLFPPSDVFNNFIENVGTGSWRARLAVDNYVGTYIPRDEIPIPLQGMNMATPVIFRLEEGGY